MAEDFTINFGTPVPAAFFQVLQQMLSGASSNMRLAISGGVGHTLNLNAGPGDAQASISIGAPGEATTLYRYVSEPLSLVLSGASGVYNIYACALGPDEYSSEEDKTERKFTLAAVKVGSGTPTGVYASRKIAQAWFDGTYITQLYSDLDTFLPTLISSILPAGLGPLPWSGAAAPAYWMICDGSAAEIAAHAALNDAIGNTYLADYQAAHGGSGPPAGFFPLPDMRGRAIVGPDNMGATGAANRMTVNPRTAGAGGGQELHALSLGEIPSHGHGVNDPEHSHSTGTWVYSRPGEHVGGQVLMEDNFVEYSSQVLGTQAAATGISIQAAGGGAGHNTMPPYLVARNWIIRG